MLGSITRGGERFADACGLQRNRFGGVKVIVWKNILGDPKTRLATVHGNLNAQGYNNQILVPETVPFIQRQQHQVTLQQNNAWPYTAQET